MRDAGYAMQDGTDSYPVSRILYPVSLFLRLLTSHFTTIDSPNG